MNDCLDLVAKCKTKLFLSQSEYLDHTLFSNSQTGWLSLERNNLRGNISFVCDWDTIYTAADCKGSESEVDCNCCKTCCSKEDSKEDKEDCGIHLSTKLLIDQCHELNLLEFCPASMAIYN